MRFGVWDPHENPGRRPKNRASGLGCGIRMKTPGTVPMTGTPKQRARKRSGRGRSMPSFEVHSWKVEGVRVLPPPHGQVHARQGEDPRAPGRQHHRGEPRVSVSGIVEHMTKEGVSTDSRGGPLVEKKKEQDTEYKHASAHISPTCSSQRTIAAVRSKTEHDQTRDVGAQSHE